MLKRHRRGWDVTMVLRHFVGYVVDRYMCVLRKVASEAPIFLDFHLIIASWYSSQDTIPQIQEQLFT